jgi:hypothetical protein
LPLSISVRRREANPPGLYTRRVMRDRGGIRSTFELACDPTMPVRPRAADGSM